MKKIKVGYLPLYIKLYDDSNPHYRDPMVDYMHMLIKMLESQGLEVVLADEVCRIKPEFDRAAKKFNDAGVSAVITQHLAYSPSLESIEALLSLDAPIIVFDTTPDYQLLKVANYKGCISANHGIHGVQDMCNLLKRNGKPYYLCVGHALHSEVVSEVVGMCRAAAVKKAFQTEKVGSVGGSFTGASRTGAKGKFELADGGTLFLDEIGEMPVEMQSVLLRALEDNCITRIGATKPINVDVRIITATNKDLTKCIADGSFRADLYYRLNVINLTMIPLRRRRADIKELAEYFLERFAHENGKNIHEISPAAVVAMTEYDWPGNVRELRNCMEYSVIVCKSDCIELEDLPQSITNLERADESAKAAEPEGTELRIMSDFFTKQRLEMAKKLMVEFKGNKSKVAQEMGVSRSTLYRILNGAEDTHSDK